MNDEAVKRFEDMSMKDQLVELHKRTSAGGEGKGSVSLFGWWKRFSAKGAQRRGKIMVVLLYPNRSPYMGWHTMIDGYVYVDGARFDVGVRDVWLHRNVPFVIIPSWTGVPISQASLGEKGFDMTGAQKTIIKRIEMHEAGMDKKKMKINWVWVIVGLGIVLYLLFGGGFNEVLAGGAS